MPTTKPLGRLHILRHTFCSRLAMRGATAKSIQELAGHQHLSTTQRYMHLSPAARESAIRLLDAPTEKIGDWRRAPRTHPSRRNSARLVAVAHGNRIFK